MHISINAINIIICIWKVRISINTINCNMYLEIHTSINTINSNTYMEIHNSIYTFNRNTWKYITPSALSTIIQGHYLKILLQFIS